MAIYSSYLRDSEENLKPYVDLLKEEPEDLFDILDELGEEYYKTCDNWNFKDWNTDYNRLSGRNLHLGVGAEYVWVELAKIAGLTYDVIYGARLNPPASWLFWGAKRIRSETHWYTTPDQVKQVYEFLKPLKIESNTYFNAVRNFYKFASELNQAILGSVSY